MRELYTFILRYSYLEKGKWREEVKWKQRIIKAENKEDAMDIAMKIVANQRTINTYKKQATLYESCLSWKERT